VPPQLHRPAWRRLLPVHGTGFLIFADDGRHVHISTQAYAHTKRKCLPELICMSALSYTACDAAMAACLYSRRRQLGAKLGASLLFSQVRHCESLTYPYRAVLTAHCFALTVYAMQQPCRTKERAHSASCMCVTCNNELATWAAPHACVPRAALGL